MAEADKDRKYIAQNRKARHDYFIEDTIEAGLVLTGTEVKAMRAGGVQLTEAYADPRGGELWLLNCHIPEYAGGNRFNHEPRRPRKLLVARRQLDRLMGAVAREGMTLVPLSLYFNPRGFAKLALGLAKGKHKEDKRATIKARDWQREKARLLRAKG